MPKKREWSESQFSHGILSSRSNKIIGEAQKNPNSDIEEGKDDLTANFHQENVRNEDAEGVNGTINVRI